MPRVIGIDDWAWRRGKRYATIVVDLERNRPIDLLPDRQADTVAVWLKAHPGVEIVARDRAGAYADGIRQGAPDAIQVADRWHLLRNLGDALGEVLTAYQRDLRTTAQRAVAPAATDTLEPPVRKSRPAPRSEQRRAATRAARLARYDEVAALNARGWSQTRIAQTLALDRKTVRVWLRAGQPPSWDQPAKGSALDPFADHLSRRWDEAATTPPGSGGRSAPLASPGSEALSGTGHARGGRLSPLRHPQGWPRGGRPHGVGRRGWWWPTTTRSMRPNGPSPRP